MQRVRVERVRRSKEERPTVLPLDPRDSDVVRAKRAAEAAEAERDRRP